jgi:hypothetical protein
MKMDSLIEPGLKQFTSFNLNQNKEEKIHSSVVEEILEESGLEMIPNSSKFSLFGAISTAIYLTEDKEDLIQKTITDCLLRLYQASEIPLRLYNFKDNVKLLNEFVNKPFLEEF